MPHETKLYRNGVHWRYSGDISFGEFVSANMEVWRLRDWPDFRFQIVDMLDAGKPVISRGEASGFTGFDDAAAKSAPQMRVAYVTDDPDWIELARDYKAGLKCPGWEVAIFDSLSEALSWVGVSESV